MPIRSMTGFAQVKSRVNAQPAFTLSLKSVNHRFLDLHFRIPSDHDGLEMKLRRLLKDNLARGHVELTLSLERDGATTLQLNHRLAGGYIRAFRSAAAEFGLAAEPDLNAILRLPGVMEESSAAAEDPELDSGVLERAVEALARLNEMREEEGRSIERELRQRMEHLRQAAHGVEKHRRTVLEGYVDRLQGRIRDLAGVQADQERILQEAALIADRSDIQEEVVRLDTHVNHFLALIDSGGEVGKKLDFLLQEMNREANTLLSKTSGLAGEALRITEMGLAMKSEIEKAREQVQNIE